MEAQVIKTSQAGIKIEVKWSASMIPKSADGFVYGQEMVSHCDNVTISKDGNIIIERGLSLSTNYPNLPAGAYGVIKGQLDGKQTVQPLSEETYNLVIKAISEAKAQAESDCDKPEPKKEPELVINPAYSHMSKQEIKAAEQRYMDKSIKAHGNVGNNSAKKEVTADSQIQMRVTRDEKAAWVKQAQAQGLKLSAWIRKKLND